VNRFGCALAALFFCAIAIFLLSIRSGGPKTMPAAKSSAGAGSATGYDLIIPIADVKPADLTDTFADPRNGHMHGALDIMASQGAAVIAAAPGRVEKIFESNAGGHTVYERSSDGKTFFYYAHLSSYAPDLREGRQLNQGDMIGRVGATGDADPSAPHLHFEIKRTEPKDPWYKPGTAINPYPLLAGSSAAR
jgi:murein DD-endopeptidase MepM/ murein hydrolase activator NlpD